MSRAAAEPLIFRWIVTASVVLAITACRDDQPVNPGETTARPPTIMASTGSGPNGTWHYAKPGGIKSGPGADSTTGAWDLQHAMKGAPDPNLGGNQLQPGDTVWLLGGDYRNPTPEPGRPVDTYFATVHGDSGLPIVFRQKRGANPPAVLRRDIVFEAYQTSKATLVVDQNAHHTEYWDFEIGHNVAATSRTAPTLGWELAHPIWNLGDYTKFVNLILHDGGSGILNDGSAVGDRAPQGVVISGCIIYNIGWDDSDGGHGHGLYLKNNLAPLVAADNIIFNEFGHGIQIYTETDQADELTNIQVKGNVIFNSGTLAIDYLTHHGTYSNLGALGLKASTFLLFEKNMLYFSSQSPGGRNLNGTNLVYWESPHPLGPPNQPNQRNANYVVGGSATSPVAGGGTGTTGADGWTVIAADLISTLPWAGVNTKIIRRTAADPNRVNVVIYHGANAPGTETVDLGTLPDGSTFLFSGDSFVVSDALAFRQVVDHDHYSTPRTLTLTAQAPPAPSPAGTLSGPTPGPAFNVFVVTRTPPPPQLAPPTNCQMVRQGPPPPQQTTYLKVTWTNGDPTASTEVTIERGGIPVHVETVSPGLTSYFYPPNGVGGQYLARVRHVKSGSTPSASCTTNQVTISN